MIVVDPITECESVIDKVRTLRRGEEVQKLLT